jgi:predicted nucleic acid-binding protein
MILDTNLLLSLLIQLNFFSATISHLLRDSLVPSLVETLYQFQTLLLHDSPSEFELIIAAKRPTASELVIKLSEVNLLDAY